MLIAQKTSVEVFVWLIKKPSCFCDVEVILKQDIRATKQVIIQLLINSSLHQEIAIGNQQNMITPEELIKNIATPYKKNFKKSVTFQFQGLQV